MDEGYGDTIVTFLERADNATVDVAAEVLGLHVASIPRKTCSEMSLPICFGGIGLADLVAWAHAAHVGAAGLGEGSAIRFLTPQDAHVLGDSTAKFRWSRPCMDG
jgi:hypothetical protein